MKSGYWMIKLKITILLLMKQMIQKYEKILERIEIFSQELEIKKRTLWNEINKHAPSKDSILENINEIDFKDSNLRTKIRQNILDSVDYIKLYTPTIYTMPNSDIEFKELKPKEFNYDFSNEILIKLHQPRSKIYREWVKLSRYYVVKFNRRWLSIKRFKRDSFWE